VAVFTAAIVLKWLAVFTATLVHFRSSRGGIYRRNSTVHIVIMSFTNCSIHIFSSSAASMFNKVSVQSVYYGGSIGNHQCSFERYHTRPPTPPFPRLKVCNPHPKLLSQDRVKLQTSNLARTFTGSIQKTLKILEKRERGRIQRLPNEVGLPLLSQLLRNG